MTLDPQVKTLLDALAALPPLDFSKLDVKTYRATLEGAALFAPGDEVAAIEERVITGAGGPLRLRLYRPQAMGPLPITVYFHGGGFVACGLDSHDNICRCLARRSASLVVSVEYRLAPEARFPAAVEDAAAALAWVAVHAVQIGADAARIAVAGDSAGGNLAAVAAQHARVHGPVLCHQLLLYPVTDCAADTESYRHYANGYYLTADMMRWFIRQYLPNAAAAQDVRASPLRQTDLRGLPAATVITAECDPLRDEGEAYAAALAAAGVPVALHRWPGQIHGFMSMLGAVAAADAALTAAAAALGKAFAGARTAAAA